MSQLSEQFNIINKLVKYYTDEGNDVQTRQAVEVITPIATSAVSDAKRIMRWQ